MTVGIETRDERRARAQGAAILFDVQGGTTEIMALLRSRAELSEKYQIRVVDNRTHEDFLRETMQRGKKRRVRN
jgi:ABC-type uncharacterized transport system YnjBCD substrate-binding protein